MAVEIEMLVRFDASDPDIYSLQAVLEAEWPDCTVIDMTTEEV